MQPFLRGPMEFTDKFIKNLKPAAKKYYKREKKGFTIRVMPSGVKTWLFIYTFDGKRKEKSYGNYPDVTLSDAHEKHNDDKKLLKNGKDPGAVERERRLERKHTPFVAEFVSEYIERYAKEHNKGWREIERALVANVVPVWGKRKITDIKRRDLVLLLDDIADRGAPVMANRVLAYTRKMFSWAVKDRAVLELNPFLDFSRPNKEESRERALNEAEIKAFWHNLDGCKMSETIKRALKLILVTGQRPGEVIGMHRNEINGDWWEIPASRTKNKQTHRVFLTKTAKQLIGAADGFIFESPANPSNLLEIPINPGKSYEVRTMTHDIKANLPHTPESKVVDRLKIPYFTPHDLRRTAATQWGGMNISEDLIDRLQNHITKKKQGVGHIYNRYSYDKEKQQALEAWERRLNRIIADKKDLASVTNINEGKRKAAQ